MQKTVMQKRIVKIYNREPIMKFFEVREFNSPIYNYRLYVDDTAKTLYRSFSEASEHFKALTDAEIYEGKNND